MNQACAAAVDTTGEEGHPKRLIVGNALEGADQICALQILAVVSVGHLVIMDQLTFESCVH